MGPSAPRRRDEPKEDDVDVVIRRCIGSTRFGIEPHDVPASEFPAQPSQRDGLGRMCRPHWRAYTTALRHASEEAKRAAAPEAEVVPVPPAPEPASGRRKGRGRTAEPTSGPNATAAAPKLAPKPPAGKRSKVAEPIPVGSAEASVVPDAVLEEFAVLEARSPGAIHRIRPAAGGDWIAQLIPLAPRLAVIEGGSEQPDVPAVEQEEDAAG
jgi:hypothetical protein